MKNATKLPNSPGAPASSTGGRGTAPKAVDGSCQSKQSNTPGCKVDCKQGNIVLKLSSVNGTAAIVGGDFDGTAVTINSPTQISFTVNVPVGGIKNLNLQYAIAPGDIGTLFEDCTDKTVWDANVNNTMLAVAYAVCA